MPTADVVSISPAEITATILKDSGLFVARALILLGKEFVVIRLVAATADRSALQATLSNAATIETLALTFSYAMLRAIGVQIKNIDVENNRVASPTIGSGFRQCLVFAALPTSIPLLFAASSPLVFYLLGYSHDERNRCAAYFFSSMAGYIFDINLFRPLIRTMFGIKKPRSAVLVEVLHAAQLVVIADIFLNGRFGFSSQGAASLGIAFSLSGLLAALEYYFYVAFFRSDLSEYRLFEFSRQQFIASCKNILSNFSQELPHAKQMLKKGFPMGKSSIIEFMAFSFIIHNCMGDKVALDAMQGTGFLWRFNKYILEGLWTGVTLYIADCHSHEKTLRHRIANTGIALSITFSVACLLIIFCLRNWYAEFFVDKQSPTYSDDFSKVKFFILMQALLNPISGMTVAMVNLSSTFSNQGNGNYCTKMIFLFNFLCTAIMAGIFKWCDFDSRWIFGAQFFNIVGAGAMLFRHKKSHAEIKQPVGLQVGSQADKPLSEDRRNPAVNEELPRGGDFRVPIPA